MTRQQKTSDESLTICTESIQYKTTIVSMVRKWDHTAMYCSVSAHEVHCFCSQIRMLLMPVVITLLTLEVVTLIALHADRGQYISVKGNKDDERQNADAGISILWFCFNRTST